MSEPVISPSDRPEEPISGPDERGPGVLTAALVLACITFPIMATISISPVQPAILAAFRDEPGVRLLVPALLTIPALMSALLSPVAGRLIDRFGRLHILTGGLVVYALFGTAPLWVDSLRLIVASRFVVGFADAAILAAVPTLVADYWVGRRRDKILGLVSVVGTVSAIFFLALSGALAAAGWRTPFWLYLLALVCAVLVRLRLRERPGVLIGKAGKLPSLDMRRIVVPVALAFASGTMIAIPSIELPYRLTEEGVTASATLGLIAATAAIGAAIGSIVYGFASGAGLTRILPVAFGLAGIGAVVMGLGTSPVLVATGAVMASAGAGLSLPSVLAWTVAQVGPLQRGRGSGAWTFGNATATFLLPFIALGLSEAFGRMGPGLAMLGLLSIVLAAATPYLVRRNERLALASTAPDPQLRDGVLGV